MTRRLTARALPGRVAAARTTESPSVVRRDPFGAARTALGQRLEHVETAAVRRNPKQPRKRFDPEAIAALAASIRSRGVLQPILVRPVPGGGFELIAGERRWRAAAAAELKRLPAIICEADDAEALELALIENLAREDLTAIEEATTLRVLIDDLGVTQAALGGRIGRSRSDIANTMRLLNLPADVVERIDAGELSKGHGKCLLALEAPDEQSGIAARAVAQRWSVRRLEQVIAAGSGRGPAPPRSTVGAAARELSQEAARRSGLDITVRARADGFVARITLEDRAALDALLNRFERGSI